jgi:tetratricopeptide (TPR) repeat protein
MEIGLYEVASRALSFACDEVSRLFGPYDPYLTPFLKKREEAEKRCGNEAEAMKISEQIDSIRLLEKLIVFRGKMDNALILALESYSIEEEHDRPSAVPAARLLRRGLFKDAYGRASHALTALQASGPTLRPVHLMLKVGSIDLQLENPDKAISIARTALELLKKSEIQPNPTQVDAFRLIAIASCSIGMPGDALSAISEQRRILAILLGQDAAEMVNNEFRAFQEFVGPSPYGALKPPTPEEIRTAGVDHRFNHNVSRAECDLAEAMVLLTQHEFDQSKALCSTAITTIVDEVKAITVRSEIPLIANYAIYRLLPAALALNSRIELSQGHPLEAALLCRRSYEFYSRYQNVENDHFYLDFWISKSGETYLDSFVACRNVNAAETFFWGIAIKARNENEAIYSDAMLRIGEISILKGDYEKAQKSLRKALTSATKCFGSLHSCTLEIALRLAESLVQGGNAEAARDLLAEIRSDAVSFPTTFQGKRDYFEEIIALLMTSERQAQRKESIDPWTHRVEAVPTGSAAVKLENDCVLESGRDSNWEPSGEKESSRAKLSSRWTCWSEATQIPFNIASSLDNPIRGNQIREIEEWAWNRFPFRMESTLLLA